MSTHLSVSEVITKQGNDISAIINKIAAKYDIPARLIVACAIMESNLDEQSERRKPWPDVSAGLFHQAVAWAPIGDQRTGPTGNNEVRNYVSNISSVFHTLKNNLEITTDIAAKQLAQKWRQYQDGLEALSRYNKPALQWTDNPNKTNIKRGWDESAQYETEEDVTMAEFILGFKELADKLGEEVVGKPVTDEFNLGWYDDDNVVGRAQITTKGLMVWAPDGPALFLPAITG